MNIHLLSVAPIGTNCYILEIGSNALIIDPGGEGERIIRYIDERKLRPHAILLTHAHFDHIGALDEICNYYNIEVYLNELEHPWLQDPAQNGSRMLSSPVIIKTAAKPLREGNLEIGPFAMEVIHTPGHSPGSMSFVFPKDDVVFGGDVLFLEGVGRTDLPGGDFDVLEETIRNKFYTLPEQVVVYPGHGPNTTIHHERKHNPFVTS
ncbi:MAG TPA: MBL fold metallo-hydrolase [Bacillota bacterium]|nr:MBL fold metallo-hydrolase [Bacillota bacterium]